jgi:D-alanyl-lipoteichoic acid acyltransferase DltB (MBOAT superfamily)
VLTLYALVPDRFRWVVLLVASYVFYMWWNAAYALLLVFSTVVDFFVGRAMGRATDKVARRRLLLGSLATNLGLLFTFKYWTFFHESLAAVLGSVGVPYTVPELNVLLPVGISFYTFQTLSYTIDIYRGTLRPETHFGRFAVFVAFFPQLVAGPIERASRLLPQLRERFLLRSHQVQSGFQLAMWGLFLKVIVADWLSLFVNAVYGAPEGHGRVVIAAATYGFALQIYCDFSGYSSIAIGVARMFGIDLMENFRRPYFSTSIRDFWRRWHISLSTWLRDYLYISVGGSRHGELRTYLSLMITMLLGGLWHGASWNFVIWGGLQGLFLAASRMTLDRRDAWIARVGLPSLLVRAWRVFVTFHLVCFSWIWFRAETFADATTILGILFGLVPEPNTPLHLGHYTLYLGHAAVGAIALIGWELLDESRLGRFTAQWERAPWWLRNVILLVLFFLILLFGSNPDEQFIYFQF